MSDMDFLYHVKNDLENEICPIHGVNTQNVQINGTNLQYSACCKEFGDILKEKTKEFTANRTKEQLLKTFRETLKK